MGRAFWITIAVALGLLAIGWTFKVAPAAADEMSDRARWFKELMVPGTDVSCCDISDGHPVEARFADGGWQVHWAGAWRPVPPAIVLRTVSIDRNAYLFVYHGAWRCFVPPNLGS